jgi:Zn-dependent protease with chaperone function
MLRVNGLFGWVSYNDRRSAVLFLSFVLAFHVLALAVLYIPLVIADHAHAPVYNWEGYLLRYIPLVTLAGAGLFLVQFWWHEKLVRRQTGFRYVSKRDEPRLHRIAEPLVIAAGLPEPRLAVIESRALNAFACGLDQKSAVVVVTRGLLDGLDDDELAAVVAHELIHIKNGDLRLMAAATVCQRSMAVVYNQGSWGDQKYREASALVLSMGLMPALFILFVVLSFLRHSALHFGFVTRTLISKAREFIADSEALRLTQDPAALVSALQKIDGRSELECLTTESDSMMIDGPSTGVFATHPTIAERVAAIVVMTGSMALNAPSRRDTRPSHVRDTSRRAAFGIRRKLGVSVPVTSRRTSLEFPEDRNVLGFTLEMNVAACLAIGFFLVSHQQHLTNPRLLAAQFDVTNVGPLLWMASPNVMPSRCNGINPAPDCTEAEIQKEWAELNGLMKDLADLPGFILPGGFFTSVPPPAVKLQATRQNACFHARYQVGDRGLYSVDEPEGRRAGDISMSRYIRVIEDSVVGTDSYNPVYRDERLKNYVDTRKLMIEVTHRFFGEPGLAQAIAEYGRPEHAAVVSLLKERMADPAFTKSLKALDLAEYELLTENPSEFISCVAREARSKL